MASTCPVCMAPLPEGANACPTCGFKLLGKTQAFKPIASDAQASASSPIFDEARLRIVRGPQVGNVFRLAADVITIGRSPQCDIFLNDMTVSRSLSSTSIPSTDSGSITETFARRACTTATLSRSARSAWRSPRWIRRASSRCLQGGTESWNCFPATKR